MKPDKHSHFQRSACLPQVELRVSRDSSACYQAHTHDEFSFGAIDKGAASYRNQRISYQTGRGDLVTINPGDVHACNPERGAWSYRMVFVDSLWLGKAQSEAGLSAQDYLCFAQDQLRSRQSLNDFNRLFVQLADSDGALDAESQLLDFVLQLSTGAQRLPALNRAPEQSLLRVREQLLDQLDSRLSLAELAEEAQLSRYQLLRSFARHYGLSPAAMQMDARINQAKQLLRSGSSLAETAVSLGFADQAHFQRHFKKRVALTPGQYQAGVASGR
ncbi:helix-turn-helix domain-containing protein [Aliagarivorans taiwanensis]|uniref:helix-turn-helix domain-containing protein n=1 Tax=Aliagarivorans taiwanensis TaxID=561966 RepID=UPI0004136524|nr:AraC family transcriptional regulator [Aliagarivorans taiwanensis]